ncbi:MAG: hypothetical protein ACMUIP_15040 [bacterium]
MSLGKRFIVCVAIIIITAALVNANPIPYPLPANMPLEDMYSVIEETDRGGLKETFFGDYYFSYIPTDVYLMKYPVPPKSEDISVAMGRLPEDWWFSADIFPFIHQIRVHMDPMKWYDIRELYPTVLPEWPGIPMVAWNGPFPQKALLSVKYQHDLLKRRNNFIYFYALGTGKYFQTYQKEALAFLDITMPPKYNMHRLFLDWTSLPFAETYERDDMGIYHRVVSICATAQFGPFTHDIIGYIRRGRSESDANVEESDELEADLPLPPQITLRYAIQECGTTEPPEIKPNVVALGRKIIITDQIFFNCCPEYVRMTILVTENQVIFQEKAMEEAPCDCVCYYPMKGAAGPFAPGTYDVQLINPYGKKILEKELKIK